MVLLSRSNLLLVLALGDVVFALSSSSLAEVANSLTPANASALLQRRRTGRMRVDQWLVARRKQQGNSSEHHTRNKSSEPRSTSSDSNKERSTHGTDDDGQLKLSSADEYESKIVEHDGTGKNRHNKYWPVSTEERKGWRKWHRKCTPCTDVLQLRWKNPSISWICGAYQRARRTFKNECMMHLRNCQDGTMFIKISDHRCHDDETGRFGIHFFYEYHVKASGESDSPPETEEYETSDSYGFVDTRRALKRRAGVSLQSGASANIKPRRRVHVISSGTANSSVSIDVQNPSGNITTKNANIRLTEVVNTASEISNIHSSKVKGGNGHRLASNVAGADYAKFKLVSDFATRTNHSAKVRNGASVSRRVYNGGLANAIRAVSNFGLSLTKFTAHYGSVGHAQLAVQRSKSQRNKQNRIVNRHMKTTSLNRTMSTPSLHVSQPHH